MRFILILLIVLLIPTVGQGQNPSTLLQAKTDCVNNFNSWMERDEYSYACYGGALEDTVEQWGGTANQATYYYYNEHKHIIKIELHLQILKGSDERTKKQMFRIIFNSNLASWPKTLHGHLVNTSVGVYEVRDGKANCRISHDGTTMKVVLEY